ncbi:hypothetical protein [Cohnella sp. REN36]|uniref:hypothetical protein n=1 Tax=Cohnella sp. REN36 TaxID=2887347 RepID=UPI001D14FB99|nr:hypothetical protein [Cohnella sp. REN36]MCC3374250.1 hypothetical protein [Cohnella sp. REN36]
MIGTTGVLLNNQGGVNLILTITNDSFSPQVFEGELFFFDSSGNKVGAAHSVLSVPAQRFVGLQFDITGQVFYELQVSVSSTDVVVNTFSVNASGSIAAQRVLNTELSPISALTPIP